MKRWSVDRMILPILGLAVGTLALRLVLAEVTSGAVTLLGASLLATALGTLVCVWRWRRAGDRETPADWLEWIDVVHVVQVPLLLLGSRGWDMLPRIGLAVALLAVLLTAHRLLRAAPTDE